MSEPAGKQEFQPGATGPARLADRVARHAITGGGVLIIVSVIAIIVFILLEAFPLFRGAEVVRSAVFEAPAKARVLAAGADEYHEVLFEVLASGTVVFRDVPGGESRGVQPVPDAGDAPLTATSVGTATRLVAWGDAAGRAGVFQLRFQTEFLPGGGREVTPGLEGRGSIDLGVGGGIRSVAGARHGDGVLSLAAVRDDGSLRFGRHRPGGEPAIHDLTDLLDSPARAVDIAADGSLLAVGTEGGQVLVWNTSGDEPRLLDRTGVTRSTDVPVTTLAYLLGDISMVVGGGDGSLAVWSRVPDPETNRRSLKKIHEFPPHGDAVVALAASPRGKGFLSGDAGGEVRLQFSTSERTLAAMRLEGEDLRSIQMSPRADGALLLGGSGRLSLWKIHNPHPEVSWRTLFGKVWYEGHPEPDHVWQSSGASDEFEPKLSLVPLLFGTIKGAVYALIFSVPIAVLGAIYISQFAHPRVRRNIKPLVEILAALPSVIIGFLGGLWLAPLLARTFPEAILLVVLVPAMTVAASMGWEAMPRRHRGRAPVGSELYVIAVAGAAAFGLALLLGPSLERLAFGGDFPLWVSQTLGLRFDPRNSVVVGFALGFAVIPIIFTIAEDALSSVPRHLVTASLALGASRWATTWRVVVPTASAGIFSAVMLGFGRAVGETMIVLMATGNTPIMEWNPFTGMRTLSANIAVEIPEAPHGGTLYRVLFLSAALLFVLTFLTNTVAELVSYRLRRKYQRL